MTTVRPLAPRNEIKKLKKKKKRRRKNSKLILRARRNGKSNVHTYWSMYEYVSSKRERWRFTQQSIYIWINFNWYFSYGKFINDLQLFFLEFSFTTLAWGVMMNLTDAWKSPFIKKFIIIDISFSRWKEGINHLFVRLHVKYLNSILFWLVQKQNVSQSLALIA